MPTRTALVLVGCFVLWGGGPGSPAEVHPVRPGTKAPPSSPASPSLSDPCATPPIPGGAVLCGRVTDGRSGEVPTQVVVAVHAHRNGTIADAEGGYRLDLPVGLHWVAADRVGYHPWVRPVRLAPGDVRRMPIALTPSVGWSDPITPGFPTGDRCPAQASDPAAHLSGRMLSGGDLPLAGIRVWVGVLHGEEPGCGAVTDEDGTFTLPGLPAGELTLIAGPAEDAGSLAAPSRPALASTPLLETLVTLSPGDSLQREFRLSTGG